MTEKPLIRRTNDNVKQEVSFYNSLFEDSTAADERKNEYKNLVT
ncbi:unnamed protein product, partial [Rotaria sp. Silwood1]